MKKKCTFTFSFSAENKKLTEIRISLFDLSVFTILLRTYTFHTTAILTEITVKFMIMFYSNWNYNTFKHFFLNIIVKVDMLQSLFLLFRFWWQISLYEISFYFGTGCKSDSTFIKNVYMPRKLKILKKACLEI